MRTIESIVSTYMGDVEKRFEKGGVELLGRSTGFSKIDEATGGLQPDELWVVSARAGAGKSSFVIGMALNVEDAELETLLFSLEMSGEMLVNRMLSYLTGVAAGKIVRGKLTEAEWRKIRKAAKELQEKNISIYDRSITSDEVVETVCDRQNKVGLTIVDYAGILADSNDSTLERMAKISQNMKKLTRPDYSNAPVILVTQLNRASEQNADHRPVLSNIKDSDNFAADASVVLFPFRKGYYEAMRGGTVSKEEDAEIIIAKNRNGPVITTPAKFYPNTMRWVQ